MKTKNNNLINFKVFTVLTLSLFLVFSSCKSKKEIVTIEDDKEKEEIVKVDPNIAISIATLQKLINNYDDYSIEDKEASIAKIKTLQLKNKKVDEMIVTLEDRIASEKEKIKKAKDAAKPENRLIKFFGNIASASSSTDADYNISQALKMFNSPAANVLVIINEENYVKDYDKPTNIKKYLERLKDTKNSNVSVEEIKYDANKKIKTLILRKIK